MSVTAIINIGKLVSGDIDRSVLDADTILIEDGKILKVGTKDELDTSGADKVIDANGMVVTPGLIDSHVHPVIGDWHPRQGTIGWIERCLHGGVTTMISQGASHVQGSPRDRAGVKALAILAKKTFDNYRPGGVKVHGGAVILFTKLDENDFKELAGEGVWLIAEIGGSGLYKYGDVGEMVDLARKYGMKVSAHFGAMSIPGSATMTADDIIKLNPDVAVHCNGGTTAPCIEDVEKLVKETDFTMEVIHNGNLKVMLETIKLAQEQNALDRIIIGNDHPVGSGLITLGIIRVVTQISSVAGIPAEKAIAMATGNTAQAFGLNTGKIETGREADLLVMDSPMDSVGIDALEAIEAGDIPGIAMIMVDGKIMAYRARNTPLSTRKIKIDGVDVGEFDRLEDYFFGVPS